MFLFHGAHESGPHFIPQTTFLRDTECLPHKGSCRVCLMCGRAMQVVPLRGSLANVPGLLRMASSLSTLVTWVQYQSPPGTLTPRVLP